MEVERVTGLAGLLSAMITYRTDVPLTPPQSSPESHGNLDPEIRLPRNLPAAFLSE